MSSDEKADLLAEVEQLFNDAYKVIAYYLEMELTTGPRTGTYASATMRQLGESVLHRLR